MAVPGGDGGEHRPDDEHAHEDEDGVERGDGELAGVSKEGDLRVNPLAAPRSAAAREVIAAALAEVAEFALLGVRQAPRADQREVRDRAVTALLCGALKAAFLAEGEPERWTGAMVVPLGRAAWQRDRTAFYGVAAEADLGRLAGLLTRAGWLAEGRRVTFDPKLYRLPKEREGSTWRAGERLLTLAREAGLGLGDIGERAGRRVLVARERRERERARRERALVAYVETAEARAMMQAVEAVNAALDGADLGWTGGTVERADGSRWRPYLTRRRLRRLFLVEPLGRGEDANVPRVVEFTRHGRFYGGWWIDAPSAARLAHLTIDGQPVAVLDYAQSLPRLAYGWAGAEVPRVPDIYGCGGFGREDREGVKALLNAALSSPKPLTRWPRRDGVAISGRFGSGVGFGEAYGRLREAHAPIAHLFGTGVGAELTKREADILAEVLARCLALGVVALPIHDAVAVRRDRAAEVATIMREAFGRVGGVEGKVKVSL